ncbi:MAG TPA: class I SAM-dependent methyltransferase [Longimicrobiales bacterium]|nr:class I SAM-dependent methyltransferase [Longimicrobiales bacterium]
MSMWDQRYARDEYIYGTTPNDFLASVADRIPAGPVLCLADGEGRNGAYLAARGHEVTSVDASSVGLEKARKLAETQGVTLHLVHADLADFGIAPGAWAGIVSIFLHLPPALRARVHAASVAGLRPGGVFVLEAYTPDQLHYGTGGPREPDLLMTRDAVGRELDGLELRIARELVRTMAEGIVHHGESAVVQILGVKPG